ncbi:DUF3829 domain-containing protein [Pragia fontium]|uniref:DUF3829 domain-containing protein n=2 Tax=Pragia fontium TaxID=82985 RepID=A0AAJ5BIG5_9GAMM|nr:DUF3829 domain-containing protein [Pragia fontium]AKJ43671.1 hypothetical protein QQ39_17760 [Pragia fontium]GKX64539.1 hypothetical protein SOASR032_31080 [Pragia fontium]SFD34153.1 Protein of unknown function [Pragia fontium DSM 5563 = ATCC 49100]VEJ57062.1 Uncharacterised protein [Pragia fontium]
MNKLTITKRLLLASLIAGLLAGCDDKDAATSGSQPPKVVESVPSTPAEPKVVESVPASATQQSTSVDQTAQEAEKGNLWLDVFNNKSSIDVKGADGKRIGGLIAFNNLSRIPDAVEKYMELTEKNGKFSLKKIRAKENTLDPFFTMRAFSPLGKVSSTELENYKKAGEAIKNMKPAMPEIDEAGLIYISSVIAMSKATDTLIDYYKTSEEFKLDDFKKAPELHKTMAEAYKNYEAAKDAARVAHNNLYEQLHAKELASLKAKGFDTMVVIYTSIDDVSAIFDGLVNDYNKNGNLKKSDKAAYEAKAKLIETALDELKKAQENPATLIKESLKESKLSRYIEALNAFNISAKVAVRDMGKNKDENLLNDLQNKQLRVIERYNDIVQG